MLKYTTKIGINVYIAEEGEKISADQLEEDFAYVVCDKGLFAKRKNFLYEGLFKVEGDTKILGEVENTIVENTELKIPENLFHSIERFFKRIYDKQQTEVECFLYYNTETKKWAYAVPQQTVTSSHVSYDEKKGATYILEDNLSEGLESLPEGEEGWVKIGTIHSHSSMNAFHSGTDDADEFGFDGIHITIGNLNSPRYSYACRVMYGKTAFKKELHEVVDFPTPPGDYPAALEGRVSKETYSTPTTYAPVKSTGYHGYTGYSDGASSYYWNRRNSYGGESALYDDDYEAYLPSFGANYNLPTTQPTGGSFEQVDTHARARKGSKKGTKKNKSTYQYASGMVIAQEEK